MNPYVESLLEEAQEQFKGMSDIAISNLVLAAVLAESIEDFSMEIKALRKVMEGDDL